MNLQSIIITDSMGVLILIVLMLSSYLVRQRRQISDRIRTSAKLFDYRVLPAVRRQRIAVFKHIISLLSSLLYTL